MLSQMIYCLSGVTTSEAAPVSLAMLICDDAPSLSQAKLLERLSNNFLILFARIMARSLASLCVFMRVIIARRAMPKCDIMQADNLIGDGSQWPENSSRWIWSVTQFWNWMLC